MKLQFEKLNFKTFLPADRQEKFNKNYKFKISNYLLIFYRRRGFLGDVVNYAIDAWNFVDDS